MIASILFDLYETLVTERDATPVRASSLGERLGLDGAAFRRLWKLQRAGIVRGQVCSGTSDRVCRSEFRDSGRGRQFSISSRPGPESRLQPVTVLFVSCAVAEATAYHG